MNDKQLPRTAVQPLYVVTHQLTRPHYLLSYNVLGSPGTLMAKWDVRILRSLALRGPLTADYANDGDSVLSVPLTALQLPIAAI